MTLTRPFTRRTVLLGGAALAAGLAAPHLTRGAPATETVGGIAFGSSWRVTLPAGQGTEALAAGIVDDLVRIDRQMSPWRADSDLSRFNRALAGAIRLPGETLQVVRTALAVGAETGGAFDPTVGPLVARWGFGPIEGKAPRAVLRLEDEAVVKAEAGATIDLCGIAKGHALDRIAARLAETGIESAFVEVGGEVATLGRHPQGRTWRVGVEDPRPDAQGLAATLSLGGMALATSGTRWNSRRIGGRLVSHVIDPATRNPVGDALASVTVLAETGARADAWATALLAAGPVAGPRLARRAGIAALFLVPEGDGLRHIVTEGIEIDAT